MLGAGLPFSVEAGKVMIVGNCLPESRTQVQEANVTLSQIWEVKEW